MWVNLINTWVYTVNYSILSVNICFLVLSFSCAASVKVDNDLKRFEYHGPRRVWDGKTIMKQIRGKSNLYILEGEVQ